jgi:CRP/FNR family cyclic AMP-dependent transcriptional regulator
MHAETMEELLGDHPFFAGLGADALRLMAGCASNVHFAQGEFIFSQGGAANRFYVLRHGRVALEIHSPGLGPLVIDTMDEGEVLGWSWLIPPYRYFGDARAVTPVSATALDGTCLRGKCEADAELGYQLLKRVTAVMYDRLQSTRVRLLDLYGPEPTRALLGTCPADLVRSEPEQGRRCWTLGTIGPGPAAGRCGEPEEEVVRSWTRSSSSSRPVRCSSSAPGS